MLELNRYECNLKEGWIGLKDYLTIKKDKQDKIFFMFSPNKEISKLSPFLEPYNKASIPVLITHTHIDEAVFRDQI
jgi:HSP90 family molecular chaperone